VLTALADLGGLDLPIGQRPRLAQRAENLYAGAPTGIMDQSAVIRCRGGPPSSWTAGREVEQISFDLDGAGLATLVSTAGRAPASAGVRGPPGGCESRRALGVALRDVAPTSWRRPGRLDGETRRRVRHVVTEDQRVLGTVGCSAPAGYARSGRC
jgi:galactokinase